LPEESASRSTGTAPTASKNQRSTAPCGPFWVHSESLATKRIGRGSTTGIRKLSMLARWFEAMTKPPSLGTFSSPLTRGFHSSPTGPRTSARAPV
jgi:hypothetical protein